MEKVWVKKEKTALVESDTEWELVTEQTQENQSGSDDENEVHWKKAEAAFWAHSQKQKE